MYCCCLAGCLQRLASTTTINTGEAVQEEEKEENLSVVSSSSHGGGDDDAVLWMSNANTSTHHENTQKDTRPDAPVRSSAAVALRSSVLVPHVCVCRLRSAVRAPQSASSANDDDDDDEQMSLIQECTCARTTHKPTHMFVRTYEREYRV